MTRNFARNLRKNMTDSEKQLWQFLRQRQVNGYKFRRQAPIGPYIVDFVCYEKRLILELDGGQHQDNVAYDASRDEWLKQQGFIVVRFWNNDVLQNTQGVLETIAGYLSPPP